MKKNLISRLVSLVLTLSILFSCMTVLSYAYDGTSAVSESGDTADVPGAGTNILVPPEDGVILHINRTFDDGMSYSEGFIANAKAHKFELVDDGTGNKYFKMTARIADGATKTADGYFNINVNGFNTELDTVVIQLDVIFDSSSGKYPNNLNFSAYN